MVTTIQTRRHNSTSRMDIHEVVRVLNAGLGSTLVAAASGSKDRKLPLKWAKPDGPTPSPDFAKRLLHLHRQWTLIEEVDGPDVARQWFIGGNPSLGEQTPLTAIREDRLRDVSAAVDAFLETPEKA